MWELRVERKDVSGKELLKREFSLSYEVGKKGVLGVVPGRICCILFLVWDFVPLGLICYAYYATFIKGIISLQSRKSPWI